MNETRLILKEHLGHSLNGNEYLIEPDKTNFKIRKTKSKTSSYVSLNDLFKTVFLPEGFPNSVSEDYVSYQIWDTLQVALRLKSTLFS